MMPLTATELKWAQARGDIATLDVNGVTALAVINAFLGVKSNL